MSGLLNAARDGDLEKVQRLVAEGADVQERDPVGYTPLQLAAMHGHIPIMHWLLTEDGSSSAEQTTDGESALVLAVRGGRFLAMQWLLEEHGASLAQRDMFGRTVWDCLWPRCTQFRSATELLSLLRVMVMLEDAPHYFHTIISSQCADICARGRQFRAQLPSYLEQQRAAVVAHCPLPAVLQSLVGAYAATTPEDMWTDGLRVQAPRAKRGRTRAKKEDEDPPLRRSLRLHQKGT
jgi:hypothetical protein